MEEAEIVSLKQYNNELETADKEVEAGRYITHKDVLKRKKQRNMEIFVINRHF
jgi:hypothetical protein